MYGPPEKPGRPRGGLLGPWRPESCGPVPAQAGTSGSGRPTSCVRQTRTASPPGQGLFREPGAVARPGSERTAPARGPAWPCWPPPRCWPWPRPRRPSRRRSPSPATAPPGRWLERTRSRQASRPIPIRSRGRQAACRKTSISDSPAILLKRRGSRTVTRTAPAQTISVSRSPIHTVMLNTP